MTLTRQPIQLSNSHLSLLIQPETGGRIEELVDRRTGKHWVWHPTDYATADTRDPRELPIGASFDENWQGGWDDVFPNDCAGPFNGFEFADHGELWSRPWSLVERTETGAQLSLICRTIPASVEKQVSIDPNEPRFSIRYSIRNLSDRPLPFLFKLQPAIPVEPGDRIVMPRCVLEPVDAKFSSIAELPGLSEYPYVRTGTGAKTRMDLAPASFQENPQQEFLYASGLHEPWCAIRNERTSTTLRIDFDPEQIPFVWLFMSYGKWHGHSVVMLEPSTNKPHDLDSALSRGSCGRLAPREIRNLDFRFSLNQGPLPE